MIVKRELELDITGGSPGAAIDALRDALGDVAPVPVRLYLEEAPGSGAIAELAGAFGTLGELVSDDGEKIVGLGPGWDGQTERGVAGRIGWDALAEIAYGVPSRFDLYQLLLVFGPFDALGASRARPPEAPARRVDTPALNMGGEVVINSFMGAHTAWVSVFTPAPAAGAPALPPLSPEARAIVDACGTVRTERVSLVRPPDTAARRDAARRRLARTCDDVVRSLSLASPPKLDRATATRVPGPKAGIVAAFEPLGYRYQSSLSGHGRYRLDKMLDHHCRVVLDIGADAGTWSRDDQWPEYDVYAVLSVLGPDWSRSVSLPLAPKTTSMGVRSLAAWNTVLDNLARAVTAVEPTLVANALAVYGPGLAWLAPARHPDDVR